MPPMTQGSLLLPEDGAAERGAEPAACVGLRAAGAFVAGAEGAAPGAGVPHMLQKRPPGGIELPQSPQTRSTSRADPHCEQNFPLAAAPQTGQGLVIPG